MGGSDGVKFGLRRGEGEGGGRACLLYFKSSLIKRYPLLLQKGLDFLFVFPFDLEIIPRGVFINFLKTLLLCFRNNVT